MDKGLVDFYPQKEAKDGKKPWCKKCMKKQRRDYYSNNRERELSYAEKHNEKNPNIRKKWKSDNKDKLALEAQLYRKDNPEKIKAHSVLNNAVKTGKLIRPDNCESCFKECKPEGHHEDYSKPFDVEWLCKKCHANVDKREVSLGISR